MVELDPGMAFGTGLHPSTRLCIAALEEIVQPGDRVLDVGTGSGVLSIVAHKLGAAAILATDIDPIAVDVAGENAARNGVADWRRRHDRRGWAACRPGVPVVRCRRRQYPGRSAGQAL